MEDVWLHAGLDLRNSDMLAFLQNGRESNKGLNKDDSKPLITIDHLDNRLRPHVMRIQDASLFSFPIWVALYAGASVFWLALMIVCSLPVEFLYRLSVRKPSRWIRKRMSLVVVFWSFPCIKYLMSALFQFAFLALVTVAASSDAATDEMGKEKFSTVEYCLYFLAAGFALTEFEQFGATLKEELGIEGKSILMYVFAKGSGVRHFFSSLRACTTEHLDSTSNQLDALIIFFYSTGFIFRYIFIANVQDDLRAPTLPVFGHLTNALHPMLNSPKDFSRYLLAVNVILAYMRFLRVTMLNHDLGVLLIMCGAMISDVALFLVLALFVALAFTGCFMSVFRYSPDAFQTWAAAFQYTVLTYFGEWDLDALTTDAAGMPLFIILLLLALIVLVNLLIAMMGHTYETVLEEAEAEFRLAKTGIVNEYSDEMGSVMELPVLNATHSVLHPLLSFMFPHVWTWDYDSANADDEGVQHRLEGGLPKLVLANDYEYNDMRSLYEQAESGPSRPKRFREKQFFSICASLALLMP